MVNASDVVIWSADVPRERLFEVLDQDGLELRYVKLDRLALTRDGLDLIAEVQALGFRVFADAKIIEIPDKSVGVAELHLQLKPWMLNCMAGILSTSHMTHEDRKKVDGLKRFADACHAAGTLSCAVTVLTSKSREVVDAEFNGRSPVEQVLFYVEMLQRAGFTDVVCSPEEVAAIRSEPRFNSLNLNTPGIRLPGSDARDQARVNTPAMAYQAGADRLVIGSDLTNGDFAENFRRVAANLNGN